MQIEIWKQAYSFDNDTIKENAKLIGKAEAKNFTEAMILNMNLFPEISKINGDFYIGIFKLFDNEESANRNKLCK